MENKTVRQIAKEEFDKQNNIPGYEGILQWHTWKRAFDAAFRIFGVNEIVPKASNMKCVAYVLVRSNTADKKNFFNGKWDSSEPQITQNIEEAFKTYSKGTAERYVKACNNGKHHFHCEPIYVDLIQCRINDVLMDVPGIIIFNAVEKYPEKWQWVSANNEYGDVDEIDINRDKREQYIAGRLENIT